MQQVVPFPSFSYFKHKLQGQTWRPNKFMNIPLNMFTLLGYSFGSVLTNLWQLPMDNGGLQCRTYLITVGSAEFITSGALSHHICSPTPNTTLNENVVMLYLNASTEAPPPWGTLTSSANWIICLWDGEGWDYPLKIHVLVNSFVLPVVQQH